MTKKQRITGIVVEYNPFHNGHLYHIEQTRNLTQCDVLIAVMSPNFVQRGEPAFISKWDRTQAALDFGVDIVIELPTFYAVQSAETFAHRSVELLHLAGIDTLVFGSESDELIFDIDFDREALKQGRSYAYASNTHNHKSNDILGMHYTRACATFGITPLTIKRTNHYHDTSISNSVSSATAIRENYFKHNDIAHTTPLNIALLETYSLSEYEPFIEYALSSRSPLELSETFIVSEGIENLLIKLRHDSLDNLIENAISKRYTRSRIQRTLIHILLNSKKEDALSLSPFRVLGMNAVGAAYFAQNRSKFDYTTSLKNYAFKSYELKATEIYSLPKSQETKKKLLKQEVSGFIFKT